MRALRVHHPPLRHLEHGHPRRDAAASSGAATRARSRTYAGRSDAAGRRRRRPARRRRPCARRRGRPRTRGPGGELSSRTLAPPGATRVDDELHEPAEPPAERRGEGLLAVAHAERVDIARPQDRQPAVREARRGQPGEARAVALAAVRADPDGRAWLRRRPGEITGSRRRRGARPRPAPCGPSGARTRRSGRRTRSAASASAARPYSSGGR